jgi:hypothetical protein
MKIADASGCTARSIRNDSKNVGPDALARTRQRCISRIPDAFLMRDWRKLGATGADSGPLESESFRVST